MEFGERRQLVPRVYSPQGEKLVRSVHLSEGCQHSCVLPARHWRERAERTHVDTPPAGMTERTRLSSRGEYTQGTSCPDPELQWLRIAVTITSVVSAVTPEVWMQVFLRGVTSHLDIRITWESRRIEAKVRYSRFFTLLTFWSRFGERQGGFRSCEYKN